MMNCKTETKIFTKTFDDVSSARKEYHRAMEIYHKTLFCEFLNIPKPLSIHDKNIYFELIENSLTLYELKNKIYISNPDKMPVVFFNAGKALAEFHDALNLDVDFETNKISLHGDFWVNNVLINKKNKKIYFVDFSKSKHLKNHSYDYYYRDLATFIVDIIYKYPLYIFFLRYRKLNRIFVNQFIKGYVSYNNKINIDISKLSVFLLSVLNEKKIVFKNKNIVSKIIWNAVLNQDIKKEKHKIRRNYRSSHLFEGIGDEYDFKIYDKSSGDYYVWLREKDILNEILSEKSFDRYMDFACGTGRILSEFEKYAKYSIGIDISEEMLEKAKKKNLKSELILGDAIESPHLIKGKFNLITSFRFFLNADPSLRENTFKLIKSKLSENGLLIFNNHGNRKSLRHFIKYIKTINKYEIFNELSHEEIMDLLDKHGFHLIDTYPINYFPKIVIKLFPIKVVDFLNSCAISLNVIEMNAIQIIYVCRRK